LAINRAGVTVAAPQYLAATNLSQGWANAVTHTANSANHPSNAEYSILPFNEIVAAAPAVGAAPFGPYSVTAFRGLVTSADISYTGSTLNNEGVCKVFRGNMSKNELTQINVNTETVRRNEYTVPSTGFSGASNLTVFPARQSHSVRNVVAKPEYVNVEENTIGVNVRPWALDSTGAYTSQMVFPGLDYNGPVTFVEYSGLNNSASITVELRACLQMVPSAGVMSGMAKPSPAAAPSVLAKVSEIARSIPASTVAKAVRGYMAGGLPGAIAGALM